MKCTHSCHQFQEPCCSKCWEDTGQIIYKTTEKIGRQKAKFIDDFIRENTPSWLLWLTLKTKSNFWFHFFGYSVEIQENICDFGFTIYIRKGKKYIAKKGVIINLHIKNL